ncbi:MAG: 23S rRNA (guanosine(2251)-2'-O)-methyltransferase RlmB, partial [Clostridiales bacterium]|nr:23S rRNA (guanosine(2251)-2'-O)-methyltransferase RlmB [Clostridiales bacterium]
MKYEEFKIEGKNAVIEAFRSGKTIDRVFILEGSHDGPTNTIIKEAKKNDAIVDFVKKERLDQMSETGKHQGVIASVAAYEYATVEEILDIAKEKGEPPFIILL